jgi:ubiquinone/menaquinone biosynthesis C-methylase UbiE
MGIRIFTSEAHTLVPASEAYWAVKTDAMHRFSTEDWQQKYSSEVLALLPRGDALLDIGCGACQITTYLASAFKRVYAVDFSESMLAAAQQRIDRFEIGNICLLIGTAQAFPREITEVDAILAHGVLQYFSINDLNKYLLECRRVLRNDGIICAAIIPDKTRKRLYYRTMVQSASIAGNLRKEISFLRRRAAAYAKNNVFWDGIGNWFSKGDIAAAATRTGFEVEFRNAWFYDYRFHALLRPKANHS